MVRAGSETQEGCGAVTSRCIVGRMAFLREVDQEMMINDARSVFARVRARGRVHVVERTR